MTMVSIAQTIWPSQYGMPYGETSSTFGSGVVLLDTTTDKVGWVGDAPQDLTITAVAVRLGTIAGGGGTTAFEVRIETLGSTGRPSGTLWDTNTNGTVTVLDTDDNKWVSVTLTASASVSAGVPFAIVVTAGADTPNINIRSMSTSLVNNTDQWPIMYSDVGGTGWGAITANWNWIVLSSGTPVYVPGLEVFTAGVLTAFNSGSSPDEYAAKIVLPFKCRIIGAQVTICNVAAGGDFKVNLWSSSGDEDGEVLASRSFDGDYMRSTATDGVMTLFFTAPYTAVAGTYYLGIRAETANNLAIGTWEVTGTGLPADCLKSSPCGDGIVQSTRAWAGSPAGAWADDTAKQPMFRIIYDQVDDGNGTGGGGSFGRMIGG